MYHYSGDMNRNRKKTWQTYNFVLPTVRVRMSNVIDQIFLSISLLTLASLQAGLIVLGPQREHHTTQKGSTYQLSSKVKTTHIVCTWF